MLAIFYLEYPGYKYCPIFRNDEPVAGAPTNRKEKLAMGATWKMIQRS